MAGRSRRSPAGGADTRGEEGAGGAAADAVVGSSVLSEVGGAGETLPPWGGALVLLAYAAALVTAGRLTTFARDVT